MASGFWVLRIPHRKRKRSNLDSPNQASVSASLLVCSLNALLSSLDPDCDCGWLHQDGMSLARLLALPLQPSGVRGWTRFSTVILHSLAMCKPGTHIVTVSSEQGLHSDGVLLQTGGRQMQQGNPASY
ncbi:uncharacterized protein TrAtP1_008913 [Trichoderma atroviride]|uniref:uncharacterized protein n=1 Tax=Hypocrea atroviridis TaxID=63577 RepID=UPI00331A02DE|nr:hypothetical protein TrAtP1_008913 [Trichoderma atroviride]